jgi:hypothetical protein
VKTGIKRGRGVEGGRSLRKFYFSSCKLFQMAQLSDISISLLPPLIIPTACS